MTHCNRCNDSFDCWRGVERHREHSSEGNLCGYRDKDLPTGTACGLVFHRRHKRGWQYCETCDKDFVSMQAFRQRANANQCLRFGPREHQY